MRKPESSQKQENPQSNPPNLLPASEPTSEPNSAKLVIYPFILFKDNDRWEINYFNVDFQTFQNDRPEATKVFRPEISFMFSILMLHPHLLITTAEWAQRAGRTVGAVETAKSRFKANLSNEFQNLFPHIIGQIFVPPHNYLNLSQIAESRPFSVHGHDFLLTTDGQFIYLRDKNRINETVFPAESSYRSPNVEYVLLEPALSTALEILIDNFGNFVKYENFVKEYHYRKYNDPDLKMQETDVGNVRVLRTRLLKVLPTQLQIKVGEGESMGLFSAENIR